MVPPPERVRLSFEEMADKLVDTLPKRVRLPQLRLKQLREHVRAWAADFADFNNNQYATIARALPALNQLEHPELAQSPFLQTLGAQSTVFAAAKYPPLARFLSRTAFPANRAAARTVRDHIHGGLAMHHLTLANHALGEEVVGYYFERPEGLA